MNSAISASVITIFERSLLPTSSILSGACYRRHPGSRLGRFRTQIRWAPREVPEDVTKAQASDLIDQLQQQTGRGD
ncbi:DUF3072 domain-containing protein [Mycolicibacterium pyrenivorans]|uniref:DUF3072 domain-containing protein n=1 Tax=Mycolicibacterium pyrenivorans TaxID=187102 RepID=UPI0021F3077B|nr:DUF3072 domain-containing protein [Mycolicibacterium pyrenivorans]MCV7154367.1 DUF3072 domain-containing protein [Mycolicibacterium pyrenivorans]